MHIYRNIDDISINNMIVMYLNWVIFKKLRIIMIIIITLEIKICLKHLI